MSTASAAAACKRHAFIKPCAFAALLLALGAAPRPAAEAPAAGPAALTPEECVRRAVDSSRALHGLRARTHALEAATREAEAARWPSLLLGGRYSRLSRLEGGEITLPGGVSLSLPAPLEDNLAFSLALQQPVFNGLRIRSSIRQARNLERAAWRDYLEQEQELGLQALGAFWGLVRAREAARVIGENIGLVQQHLKEVENLFARGLVTYNEVLRARMQLSDIRLRRLEAENASTLALARLDLLIGGSPADPLEPVYSFPHEERAPGSLQPRLDRAQRQRAQLAAARERVGSARAGVDVARAGWYPGVSVTGGWQYALPNPRQFPQSDRFTPSWDIGVAASVDVGRWPAVARRVEQAEAAVVQAEDALAQLADAVTLEVIQAQLGLERGREQINSARQLVSQAQENHKIVQQKFQNGLALSSELLEAELALLEANLRLSQAKIDYELGWAALERAAGPDAEGAR